jgi:hypothetical protein
MPEARGTSFCRVGRACPSSCLRASLWVFGVSYGVAGYFLFRRNYQLPRFQLHAPPRDRVSFPVTVQYSNRKNNYLLFATALRHSPGWAARTGPGGTPEHRTCRKMATAPPTRAARWGTRLPTWRRRRRPAPTGPPRLKNATTRTVSRTLAGTRSGAHFRSLGPQRARAAGGTTVELVFRAGQFRVARPNC